jgi:hypothetical protein
MQEARADIRALRTALGRYTTGVTIVTIVFALSAASVPVVMVVGCAEEGLQPHIWKLARAGDRADTSHAGITAAERRDLAARPLGRGAYDLIGVADFVEGAASRRIGQRADILAPGRVNATGALVAGHKVAVKGLFIDGTPPKINLTSVVDLGDCAGDLREGQDGGNGNLRVSVW